MHICIVNCKYIFMHLYKQIYFNVSIYIPLLIYININLYIYNSVYINCDLLYI